MSHPINRMYAFGPFRLAPDERHLWRDGTCVQLTPKAFDLLVILAESAGHLLCRHELIEQLWAQAIVEEHSLTWNISALRRALGDDGEIPRYIETVRGHGYRFIVPVQCLKPEVSTPVSDSPAAVHDLAPVDPPQTTLINTPTANPAPWFRHHGRLILVIAGISLIVLLLASRLIFSGAPAISPQANSHRPSIAVLGFHNLSNNHDLDWIGDALTEMLSTELASGHRINIVPAADIARMHRNTNNRGAGNTWTPAQLTHLRKTLGVKATIVGAYLRQGNAKNQRIRVDVHMQLPAAGTQTTTWSASATGDDLFALVVRLGQQLRGKLGLMRPNPAQLSEFIASMPSTSAAAADYASGLSALASGNALLARTLLVRATRKEPDFPLAHSALARAWMNLGDNQRAATEARQALRHSAGLSYTQRQLLLGLQAEATHQWSQATGAYQKLFDTNPDSLHYGLMLARAQVKAENYAQAKSTLAQLRKLPAPFGNDPRVMMATANLQANLSENQAYYDTAMRAARRAMDLDEDELQAKALSAAANARINLNDFTAALTLTQKAKALYANNDKLSLDVGINLERMGSAHDGLGQYDKAITAYGDANELFAGIGNRYWQAVSLNNIAGVFFRRDQLAKAQNYYARALPIFRELHRDTAVAIVLNNLSSVVDSQGNLIQAIEYETQSLALHRATGTPRSIAAVLLNLGLTSFALGRLDTAGKYLREARNVYLDQHAVADASDAVSGLADLAYARNQLDAARKGYEHALAMRRKQKVATSVAWSQRDLAELDLDTGHPGRALQWARAALPIFVQAKTRGDIATTHAVIAMALIQLGRHQQASRETKLLDIDLKNLNDPRSRLGLNIARATIAWHLGDSAHAELLLTAALHKAQAMQMKSRIYPIRLELARLHARRVLNKTTRSQILQLVSDARRNGFLFVANQAQKLLHKRAGRVTKL